jgi:pimeloyl-ACP methyl ester carboxylesterase
LGWLVVAQAMADPGRSTHSPGLQTPGSKVQGKRQKEKMQANGQEETATTRVVRSRVITPDGVRLHVETCGLEDAPVAVVLGHGWTCSTHSWHHQFDGLPRVLGGSAVRVVAYDHRGHGQSELAPVGSTRIEQLAEDLVAVLDAVVPIGPVVYAGHSMGGMTLMALADQRPELFGERIAAAALVSTSSGQIATRPFGLPARLDATALRVAPKAVNLAARRLERQALRRAARTNTARAERTARGEQTARAEHTAWAEPQRAERVERAAARAAWVELAGARLRRPVARRMAFGKNVDPAEVDILMTDLAATPARSLSGFFEALTQHDLGHALKVLDGIPVEILHGTQDRLLPPRHGNRLAQLLPSARLRMYPGAGHMLMQERPRDVTQRLAALARKVTG